MNSATLYHLATILKEVLIGVFSFVADELEWYRYLHCDKNWSTINKQYGKSRGISSVKLDLPLH